MRIQIIGSGVVGKATGELLSRLGHEVIYYDIDPTKSCIEKPVHADIHFICVPENAVEDTLKSLLELKGLIVIRSTVLPNTTKELSKKYNRHICHLPEFIRESTPLMDEFYMNRIIIGECCQEHGSILENLYKPLAGIKIIRTDPTTTEMVKMVTNSILHTLISYWDEIHQICKEIGVNSHIVGRIVSLDPRIPKYGALWHGNKIKSRCLPKDITNFIKFCESLGYEPKLLRVVKEIDDKLGGGGYN
jgi:UDPglucose 6-dehydrogenase